MIHRILLVAALSLLFDPGLAGAAQPRALGEVTPQPICFNLRSDAPYTVYGTLVTNGYIDADGNQARHRSNFRLQQGDVRQVCTSGPFYDGRKLDLQLRSLFPLFDCRTAVTGDIRIHGRRKPEGGTETWADCL